MQEQEKNFFEKYAIIATGGKQYQVIPGKTLSVEKLEGEAGTEITFTDVLFRKTGEGKFEFGQPFLSNPVKAKILKTMKGPKVIVFRHKRRKKQRTKRGHRQQMTIVRIESI